MREMRNSRPPMTPTSLRSDAASTIGRRGGIGPVRRGSMRVILLADVDDDVAPTPLPESQHAERGAGEVAEEDGQPDVARMEAAHRLQHRAHADRHDDLRNDGDEQRTARVAGALE